MDGCRYETFSINRQRYCDHVIKFAHQWGAVRDLIYVAFSNVSPICYNFVNHKLRNAVMNIQHSYKVCSV